METQTAHWMKQRIKSLQFYVSEHRSLSVAKNTIIALSLLCIPNVAQANVTSVTHTPATITISSKNATTIQARWRVARTESLVTPIPNTTVSSVSAQLIINAVPVATLAGTVSQPSNIASMASTVHIFNETFNITPALAQQIANAAPGTVSIERTFTDTQAPSTGTINIASSVGRGGALALRRIDLSFESNSRTEVVNQGENLRAVADLSFSNAGELQAEWRLVDATSSLGISSGRLLQIVRQNLNSIGEGRTRIVSPPLPTDTTGLHIVSFSAQETTPSIGTPQLRYFVIGAEKKEPLNAINITSPSNNSTVTHDTVFTWEPVAGSAYYQLEILDDKDSKTPLTGKLLTDDNSSTSISALTTAHLKSDHAYFWRIRSFDKDGKETGVSDTRQLHTATFPPQ